MMDTTIIGHFNQSEIQRIVPELKRQQETKKDFVFPAKRLSVDNDGRLILPDVKNFKVGSDVFVDFAEAERAADAAKKASALKIAPSIEVQNGGGALPIRRRAEQQLCSRLKIPMTYVDTLRGDGQSDLAAHNFNQRLSRVSGGDDGADTIEGTDGKPAPAETRMLVRTLDGNVRAVLSSRYRILDNYDLLFASADTFEKHGVDLWQLRLSEDAFDCLAVSKGIAGQVTTDRTFDPGDGWQSRWANLGGDTQYAAVRIRNSETGGGGLSISPAVMTRVCFNFNVWAKTCRVIHLQRDRDADGMIVSDETRFYESRLIWNKVRDAIATVFNPEKFAEYIATMNRATQVPIGDRTTSAVEHTVDVVAAKFEIAEGRKTEILANLFGSRDLTQYGLMQAITATSHQLDQDGAADEASTLEEVGGELVHLNRDAFAALTR